MADNYLSDRKSASTWIAGVLGTILAMGACANIGFQISLNSRVAVLESQATTFRDAISAMNGKLDAILLQGRHP